MKNCENCGRDFESKYWTCTHCGFRGTQKNRRYTADPNPHADDRHEQPGFNRSLESLIESGLEI